MNGGNMKKLLPWLIAAALLIASVAIVVGGALARSKVVTKGVTIDVAGAVGNVWAKTVADFTEATGINVNIIGFNTQDGTTLALDAMIKANIVPNVLIDFTGRASKYMVQTSKLKAMDLKPALTKEELDLFYDLGPWTRDGKILGVPSAVPGQAICVNVSLLEKYGIPIPGANWTIDEFLSAAKQLKAAGAYATVLFAANPSADYLTINWFGAFGAQIFANGDYTKTAVGSEAGLKTFRFLDSLVKDGYAPKEAPELWDDAALEVWMKGNVAFMPLRPDWMSGYIAMAKDQKLNDSWFSWKFLPYPAGPGVKLAPTVGAGSTLVVFEKGDKAKDTAAGKFVAWTSGKATNHEFTRTGSFSLLRIPTDPPADQSLVRTVDWTVVKDIAATAGWMDVGYTLPMYTVIREELPRRLQAMWKGLETPEEALAGYVAFVNEALKK
jgi:ABC-type glycerol-3-phosphate transport system substrate-binding protein